MVRSRGKLCLLALVLSMPVAVFGQVTAGATLDPCSSSPGSCPTNTPTQPAQGRVAPPPSAPPVNPPIQNYQAAAAALAARNSANQQLIGAGFSILSRILAAHRSRNDNAAPAADMPVAPDPSTEAVTAEASRVEAEQKRLNDEASQLLIDAASYTGTSASNQNTATDPAQTISALIDSPTATASAGVSAQISGLLDPSPTGVPDLLCRWKS
jgi:hypothetical protein